MAKFSNPDPGPGWHHVEIVKSVEQISKAKNPMFVVDLVVASGKYKGKYLSRDYIVLNGWAGARKLEAFGLHPEDGDEIQASELVGRRAYAHVQGEEYEGRTSLKVGGAGLLLGYDTEETYRARPETQEAEAESPKPDDDTDIPF